MRTRLIIAAPILLALAFVPGAVATTGGTFSANDPSFGSVAVGTTSSATTVSIVNHTHTAHTINSLSKGGTNPAQFCRDQQLQRRRTEPDGQSKRFMRSGGHVLAGGTGGAKERTHRRRL